MVTLLAGVVLCGLILLGLYAFGWFSTPYSDAFRFVFYLFLVLSVLVIGFAVYDHPYEGYDPTAKVP
jgi:hypothetical protein